MVDIRQTIQYGNYLSKIGWKVERGAEINYFVRKLPLVGSVLKVQRPEEIHINKIRELAKKYRTFQIIIEPKTDFDAKFISSLGFKLSKSPYLPTKTLQIDLTRSKTTIFKNLAKDAAAAVKRNLGIKINKFVSSEIKNSSVENFHTVWKRAVGVRRYVPTLTHLKALEKSFKKKVAFLVHQDSGAVFLIGEGIAYYWQAFTGRGGRKSLAQYKIVWEGILWAKARGVKIFDFEGIYDERFPNKTWLGFTHFKKSFGGYVVEYPGAFIKNRIPI